MKVIIISLALVVLIIFAIDSIRNGITPMPTSKKVKNVLLQEVKQQQRYGEIVELGAGWGTLAFPLAANHPKNHVIAVERALFPRLFMQVRKLFTKEKRIQIKNQSIYDVNVENANLIVCYLYPKAMGRLQKQFEKQIKDEKMIISHTFAIPNWHPIKVITVPDMYRTKIYIYQIRNGKKV